MAALYATILNLSSKVFATLNVMAYDPITVAGSGMMTECKYRISHFLVG